MTEGKRPCKLHPDVPKYQLDKKKGGDKGGDSKGGPVQCEDCAPWQRYILYALPALIYLPWAIGKLRCAPKCCPPPACCPQPPPQPCPPPPCQRTCAEHNPALGHINPKPCQQCPQTRMKTICKGKPDRRCSKETK